MPLRRPGLTRPAQARPRLARPGLAQWALALITTGCGHDLSGSWEGRCAFNDNAQGYESPVKLDITDGRGAILAGSVELYMYDDHR